MRRRLFSIAALALVAGCGDRKPPPRPAAPPAPPPRPAPVLQTLPDGRVVVELSGLRYAARPPRDWLATAYWSTDASSGGRNDIFVVVTPPGQPRSLSADVFVSLEAFIKNERAPDIAAKLANIGAQRKQRHPEFSIIRQAPLPLANRQRAELYVLGNNPSGDTEAIAFIDEGPVVAEMMLLGRSRAQFDQALPLFRDLVRSYGRI
ncbi:MAG: hypothetical protein KF889_03910 [Alphaproteobacteria bacterium]|nr:hypothetical protein [Alphaproteobacteria bacterium]